MPLPHASDALSRFTVLDLTRVRSGPTCVRQLADWGANAIKIVSAVETDGYKPWWNAAEITVFGMDKAPQEVRVGDATIHEWRYDVAQHAIVFTVPGAKNNWTVEIVL